MAAKKWLVIDANVARAAGGKEAMHPMSKNCRDFLESVREICHHVVMTTDISKEWKKHQSKFSESWRSSMVARRKLHPINAKKDYILREMIESSNAEEKEKEAMIKDIPLVEAALEADKIVVSLDERVRKLFAYSSNDISELKAIVWINPSKSEEDPINWLEKGARNEKERQLGNF
jgi:hypothetical protein